MQSMTDKDSTQPPDESDQSQWRSHNADMDFMKRDTEPFAVGDEVHYQISDHVTFKFEVAKYERREGKRFYKLKRPDTGTIWKDKKSGSEWVEGKYLSDASK